jgi:RNA polymerase sigma-70 factor (ECF subfamily)
MAISATDQAAFVGQITRHQSMLKAFIISLMPGLDGVDDVLQQTNLVLWEKRENFRPGSNFRGWACAIARLEVKSHRRRMIRQGKLLLSEELSEMLAEHCEASPAELDERQAALSRCLERLGENERELIDHRYFTGGDAR